MKTTQFQRIKLGIFVIAGMAIFIITVYLIGHKQNLFGNTTTVVSVFKNVSGLQEGNNVRFAGVDVGTVKKILILNDTSVVVDMNVENATLKFMNKQSVAAVGTDGLVGSMIVNILPATGGAGAPLQAGDTILSISKIATADMLATLSTTNENAALLTADLLEITNAINRGEGVLGKLINDQKMAADLQKSVENIKLVSRASSKTLQDLNVKLAQFNMDESVVGVLLTDTIAGKRVLAMIDHLDRSASRIDSITTQFNDFSNNLEEGEGVVQYAMTDTAFVNHLRNTIHNVEEASLKFNENMEALKHNFFFRGYFRKLEREQQKLLQKD